MVGAGNMGAGETLVIADIGNDDLTGLQCGKRIAG
jgi:hypothetical protein